MIKVQDWVASIPDEDKHVAYVGEGMSETREFWLCGEGWETYRNWSFHLDMAFDPESITTRESRQVVQTYSSSSKLKGEKTEDIEESVTKETYTVENEEVMGKQLTDIASLEKRVGEDGLYLTWTVLRQQTMLPGKLWATLRAVDGTAQKVKKSAIMVFEVDAAVGAVRADAPPMSELEQIEARVALAADNVTYDADRAERAVTQVQENVYACQGHAEAAQQASIRAAEYALHTEEIYVSTVGYAADAMRYKRAAQEAAQQVQACVTQVEEQATKVEERCGQASDLVDAAAQAQSAAERAAASASLSAGGAAMAAERCADHAQQCADYADGMAAVAQTLANVTYRRVNVRDYGAIGDGVTDDREAIIAAFEAAKSMLPCEVYFPAGTYGILSGITIEMEYGTGGLRVCGAGRDVTTIKYLDDYTSQQGWYAIRIWPVGRPDTIPSEDDYLHDISYTGLTVYDPDPIGHALHEAKGDPATEETHGFDIHCCKGVSVTDCQFITVGDEAIDICFCHDVVVMNNRLVGSPGAGPGGGAICIGDGCKGVVVSGNTVNGSAPDEALPDGTVIKKSNCGISIESLEYPVQDVTIIGNSIRNVHGKGVCMSANAKEASISNAIVADNIISGCDEGVLVSGSMPKDNIKITGNVIADCLGFAVKTITVGNVTICGNTFRNIRGDYALHAATQNSQSRQYIADNVFENIAYGGLYCGGNFVLKDCVFNGLGTVETAPANAIYGVYKLNGTLTVSGCVFKDVRMLALKSCLQNADYIDNTDVEVVNKTTGVADGGGYSVAGTAIKRIVGCSLVGGVGIQNDNAIVQGTKITYKGNSHAVTVSANGVSITGCIILADNGSYRAINEVSGYNHNMISNNVANKGIAVSGAQSVAVNNIDTRATA